MLNETRTVANRHTPIHRHFKALQGPIHGATIFSAAPLAMAALLLILFN
jgi:hypothetical protein